MKWVSYSQISWKFLLCSLVTHSEAQKKKEKYIFKAQDSSIFKEGIKMLDSLKEINIVESGSCIEPQEVISFYKLVSKQTYYKAIMNIFQSVYGQVKSYYNPW